MTTRSTHLLIERLLSAQISKPACGLEMSLAVARQLAADAEAKAGAMDLPIVIAVADSEGAPVLFHRMDGSLPASVEIATNKAWTAAAFRMSTDELGRLAQPGQMLFGVEASHGGRAVLFGGGMPLWREGKVIGAIGISGGTADEDMIIAAHALNQFQNLRGLCPEQGAEK
ncbi:heme-binding protein [Breoghania sp.]|uniref:GlcG/HbpS family heme-binding protein n=1 Tax=Breoghania sp. TaxID=2065378 RepID=UPI0029CA545A|nr:heme-binding protein [Breoghania sp.]